MDHASVLEALDSELWIVTASDGTRHGGLVATNVMPISIVPDRPRMIVGLSHEHFTRQLVSASGGCVLHLIDESQVDWVWHFGLEKGSETDKLSGLDWTATAGGAPRLSDALAFLDCRVETSWDVGDRRLFLLEVLDAGRRDPPTPPLRMRRMLELSPAEKRQGLKADLQADIPIQRAAIDRWRAAQMH